MSIAITNPAGVAAAVTRLAGNRRVGAWPGLSVEYLTWTTEIHWAVNSPVALGILVRDLAVAGYRVLGGCQQPQRMRVSASVQRPAHWLVIPLDSLAVRQISMELDVPDGPMVDTFSSLDGDLAGSVLRFLRALLSDADRAVLAPLYAHEIVYHVLRSEQGAHVVRARHLTPDPLGDTLDYIAAHLADPLTVETLSQRTHLSPSAFSRIFRDATGSAPYQFVKTARLQRARELLDDGVAVTRVAHKVGFVSISHFIKQFRASFGVTPGAYAATGRAGARPVRRAV